MFKDIASKFAPVERVDSTESSKDRDREQEKLTRTEPNFSFSIESKKITIEYDSIIINTIRLCDVWYFAYIDTCTISYYCMDIELLFSTKPFVQQDLGRFAYPKPLPPPLLNFIWY